MKQTSNAFLDTARGNLADQRLREHMNGLGITIPLGRAMAMEELGNFEVLRSHLRDIKDHTLNNLDYYLGRYEENVIQRGGQVHWASDASELNDIVAGICQRIEARQVAKGKSMVTEETALTAHLQALGLEVTETDLGEYIIQLADEPPSHIVGPAFHKTPEQIRELFLEHHQLGERSLETPTEMVQEARDILRDKFLNADVGIIGANALVAEDGRSMLVTNEGNGDLGANLPRVAIVCTTIDKVLPRAEDATALLRLLARSAIALPVSAYTSFYTGPRRDEDLDGPEEFHVVLLDNRRTEILGSKYQDMLRCMRCAACLNHCPVYIGAGGHAYGWVYPGPMGSVLTPLLTSLEESSLLPEACTSCGRCAEVCPAEIPLPDLLRDLRAESVQSGLTPWRWRWAMRLHAWLAKRPGLYHFTTGMAIKLMHRMGRKNGFFSKLPVAPGWSSVRELPAPQGGTFMQQWKARSKSDG